MGTLAGPECLGWAFGLPCQEHRVSCIRLAPTPNPGPEEEEDVLLRLHHRRDTQDHHGPCRER